MERSPAEEPSSRSCGARRLSEVRHRARDNEKCRQGCSPVTGAPAPHPRSRAWRAEQGGTSSLRRPARSSAAGAGKSRSVGRNSPLKERTGRPAAPSVGSRGRRRALTSRVPRAGGREVSRGCASRPSRGAWLGLARQLSRGSGRAPRPESASSRRCSEGATTSPLREPGRCIAIRDHGPAGVASLRPLDAHGPGSALDDRGAVWSQVSRARAGKPPALRDDRAVAQGLHGRARQLAVVGQHGLEPVGVAAGRALDDARGFTHVIAHGVAHTRSRAGSEDDRARRDRYLPAEPVHDARARDDVHPAPRRAEAVGAP